ncbi:MAG: HlyD family efflux transporter periplasmic adaptor subunit [Oscillospiraceae bacterium]|nr:HlyD family efflux transporter periplasmic adaptor subunit [Oscillospiraceae bacterium]
MDNRFTEYVLKHSSNRDRELKYDFMPSLLEIIERPAHKAGMVIITGFFALLVSAVIWACFSEVDIVITSQGSIQPVGNTNVVESAASGTVKDIKVKDGQHVRAGEVLIELDSKNLEVEYDLLIKQLEQYEAEVRIYNQLKEGKNGSEINIANFNADIRPTIQALIDNDISYRNNIESLENEKESLIINKKIAELQLEEARSSGTSRQIQAQQLDVEQKENSVKKADISINELKSSYSRQLNTGLADVTSKLQEVRMNIRKYDISKGYYSLTAPVSGYVQNIAVNTIGETVTPSEKLVSIVPDDAEVEMECFVKNMDIADIQKGMNAEVKLEAYPYNKYGTVDAEVSYISPSSFQNETLGNVYLVKLKLNNTNEKINLFTGLTGTTEIKTGKRTVMEYFLDPITKGFGESLKER